MVITKCSKALVLVFFVFFFCFFFLFFFLVVVFFLVWDRAFCVAACCDSVSAVCSVDCLINKVMGPVWHCDHLAGRHKKKSCFLVVVLLSMY